MLDYFLVMLKCYFLSTGERGFKGEKGDRGERGEKTGRVFNFVNTYENALK